MAAMALLLLLAGAGAATSSVPPELARLPKPHDVASATSLHASSERAGGRALLPYARAWGEPSRAA